MPGILLVEDDENLNRGITFSLKKSGYEVFSAETVKKAKRIACNGTAGIGISGFCRTPGRTRTGYDNEGLGRTFR